MTWDWRLGDDYRGKKGNDPKVSKMIEKDTYAAHLPKERRGTGEKASVFEKAIGRSCDFESQGSLKADWEENLQKRSWNFQKVDWNFRGEYERVLDAG